VDNDYSIHEIDSSIFEGDYDEENYENMLKLTAKYPGFLKLIFI
jgi:hypothetical protein